MNEKCYWSKGGRAYLGAKSDDQGWHTLTGLCSKPDEKRIGMVLSEYREI